jgi:transposase-like protein
VNRRKPTKDTALILDLLHDARRNHEPVSVTLADRISLNRASLRHWRQEARTAPFRCHTPTMRVYVRESALRVCKRLLAENKRLRSLQKQYASFRSPIHWATQDQITQATETRNVHV